jgi:hypothetical protein
MLGLEFGFFIGGVITGAIVMFFVYRNNVKTANQLVAEATRALGEAKNEIGRLNAGLQKAGIKL